ncbi:glycosyltransferase [Flagellimonas flava]|uniref:glycosyltransferase n=1 Tax=Flagellimonas flava TaxID=570519 RepID=UPI000934E614|nr:glycosyltransferase [Allomuricauda flava]
MKKILIIGHVWPEPSTTAAGHRMMQLIEAFQVLRHEIVFACTASSTVHSLDLEDMGVRTMEIKLNNSSFDEFLLELKPDLVVFDRFMTEEQFGWRVAEFSPRALRVLNTEDLHALRKSREESFKQHKIWTVEDWKNHPMTIRELTSIFRCDLSLMISSYEMELLKEQAKIPEQLLLHLPFMLEPPSSEKKRSCPSFIERSGFICVGNGKHAPNVEAFKILKQNIWPKIREELPTAKLSICGAYLPQQVLEMHNPKEGFEVKGWVEDLDKVVRNARLLLAPIQFGAGIKGKLIDAMSNGTPSITTPIGAEGMHASLQWPGAICGHWEEFAQSAIHLYTQKDDWRAAQERGVVILQKQYQKSTQINTLKSRFVNLQNNLQFHRSQNLMGRILQQQTVSASKYMAKWIEEKNRK